MNTITVTLIRHGDTPYNHDEDKLNCRNVGLSTIGRLQASSLYGEYEAIIVSPLARALMTLYHSNIHSSIIEIDDNIREYKKYICDFLEGEPLIYETEPMILERCHDVLNDIKQSPFKRICLFTHANWIKYFTHVVGQPLDHYPDNCERIDLSIQK